VPPTFPTYKRLLILTNQKVSQLVSVSIVTYSVGLGIGKHIDKVNPINFPTLGLTGNIISAFSILAATWSKTSFAITLLRITQGGTKAFIWFVIISINLAMDASALFQWIRCDPVQKTWLVDIPGTCWDPRVAVYYGVFAGSMTIAPLQRAIVLKWLKIALVYSGVMDITLSFLPWTVLWGLQMKPKEKLGIGLAMSMGVLLVTYLQFNQSSILITSQRRGNCFRQIRSNTETAIGRFHL
jgi:hypothetical protein